MIYISPTGSFNNIRIHPYRNDSSQLIKVQFENSLQLGWKEEDIILVTNFDYQYGHLKSHAIKDIEFFKKIPEVSKVNALNRLFDNGMIEKRQLYWFHDIDAFQLAPITESEIDLGEADIGMADYGRRKWWNTGSIFFKSTSKDIFRKVWKIVHEKTIDEENAFSVLIAEDPKIKNRIKTINRTYNLTPFGLRPSLRRSIKPIRVVHFHPLSPIKQLGVKKGLDYFKGDNYMNTNILTDRLIRIFKYHRIK